MKYRVGIDLGGTSAKIACVTGGWKIVRETSVSTSGFPNSGDLARRISFAIKDMLGKDQAERIGIGVAGDIDPDRGVIRISPNLGWKNVPLKKLFQRHFNCPIFVENDANAAGWGVYKTQAPKNISNVIVMTLGTGVGGGIILNGRLYRGATGSAGEIGHMNIAEKGPLCNCGNRGCLETYVGGPHLIKKVRSGLGRGVKSSLQAQFRENPAEITPYLIAQAARRGDRYSQSIWEGVGHALGLAIGDLVYILNPQMIFFTGGIAQAGPLILGPLWRTLRQRAFKTPVNAVSIKVAREASHIGVLGAALL